MYVCVCLISSLWNCGFMHAGRQLVCCHDEAESVVCIVQARSNLCLLDVLFASEQTNLLLKIAGVLNF